MTTLRVTFYLLLAVNLVGLAVLALPWLDIEAPFLGVTEPDRISSQVLPDKLRIISVGSEPPSAAVSEVPTSVPGLPPATGAVEEAPNAASAPAVAVVASMPAASPAESTAAVCVAFRNLTGAQAQALAQRVRSAGEGLAVREEAAAPSSYWVNIPPQGGKEGAERRAAELKKLGLEDFFIVQDAGDNRYAISLGLFRAEGLAERQLETLQKRGIKGAKVTARENVNGARVELSGAAAQIERVVREASSELKGALRDSCKAG